MENKISKGKALLCLAITWLIFYLLGSLFSLSFTIDEWNTFSKIIFWGPSLLLSVWTINDYFIFPER